MMDAEHLDRTERFVGWLEQRRREAGLTQQQLCEAASVSYSYYTKIVSIRRFREKFGDGDRRIQAPKSLGNYDKLLTVLEGALGRSLSSEALFVWQNGTAATPCPPEQARVTADLIGLILQIQTLSPENRKLVEELVSRLR